VIVSIASYPIVLISPQLTMLTRRYQKARIIAASNAVPGDHDFERVRNEANEMASVGIERDSAPTDLKAVRTGIGQALRALHSKVLREEVPDRIAELLRQLDQQLRRLDQKDQHST
jgi:hypothetical protein